MPDSAAAAECFRRWLLLRFGHGEAAFSALKNVASDADAVTVDVTALEAAARRGGFSGPQGGAVALLGSSTVDAATFVAALVAAPTLQLGVNASRAGVQDEPRLEGRGGDDLLGAASEGDGDESQLRAACAGAAERMRRAEAACRRAASASVSVDAAATAARSESSLASARLQAGEAARARLSLDLERHRAVVVALPATSISVASLREEIAKSQRRGLFAPDAAIGTPQGAELEARLEGTQRTEARLHEDLAVVMRDSHMLRERITTAEAELAKLPCTVSTRQLSELESECLSAEGELTELQEEAAAAVFEALLVAPASTQASESGSAAVAPEVALDSGAPRGANEAGGASWSSGLAGLLSVHGALTRRWSRRQRAEATALDELRATKAALGALESRCEGRGQAARSSELRAEVAQAREASELVWGMAANLGGEASQSEALRERYASVQEDQQRELCLLRAGLTDLQRELDDCTRQSQEAEVLRLRRLAELRERGARQRLQHSSLCGELQAQEHGVSSRLEAASAAEQEVHRGLQLERGQALLEVRSLLEQASALRATHAEVVADLRSEREVLDTRRRTLQNLEAQAGVQRDQAGVQIRLNILHVGLGQLERIHGASQKGLIAERDEARLLAERTKGEESRMASEVAALSAAVGGRTAAEQRLRSEEQAEQLAQVRSAELHQAEKANALLRDFEQTRELVLRHDAHREAQAAEARRLDRRRDDGMQAQVQRAHREAREAELREDAARREVQVARLQATRALHEEVDTAKRSAAEAFSLQVQEMRAELVQAGAEEAAMLIGFNTEEASLREAAQHAEAAYYALVIGAGRNSGAASTRAAPLPAFSGAYSLLEATVPEARGVAGAAELAEAPLHQLLRWARERTTREVAAPLGKLLRRRTRLASEATAVELQREHDFANQLERAEAEHSRVQQRMVLEMSGAASHVEALQRLLRVEVAALREGGERQAGQKASLKHELHEGEVHEGVAEARLEACKVAGAEASVEKAAMEEAQRRKEHTLQQETLRLQILQENLVAESARARHLSSFVSAHSDILDPARERELKAFGSEGQLAAARLRTELAAERRAAQALSLQLAAVEKQVKENEGKALQASGDAATLAAHAVEVEVASTEHGARSAAAEAERHRAVKTELFESAKQSSQLQQDVDRRMYDIQHLERLGVNLEREVERRLASRAAAWREQLGSLESEAAQHAQEQGLRLKQTRPRLARLEATFARLQHGPAATASAELARARAECRRWGGGSSDVALALSGGISDISLAADCSTAPAPVEGARAAAAVFRSAVRSRRIAATTELASMRTELTALCQQASASAASREARAAQARKREALRELRAASAAANEAADEAAFRRVALVGGLGAPIAQLAELGDALSREKAACVVWEHEIDSMRLSVEAAGLREAERSEVHHCRAESELAEVRGAIARVRSEALEEGPPGPCALFGKWHHTDACRGVGVNDSADGDAQQSSLFGHRLLERLDAANLRAARWRRKASVACAEAREKLENSAQLRAEMKEREELREILDRQRGESAAIAASCRSAEEAWARRRAAASCALRDAHAGEAAAASAAAALWAQQEGAATRGLERLEAAESRKDEMERELYSAQRSLASVQDDLLELDETTAQQLLTVRARQVDAESHVRNIEEHALERLRNLESAVASINPPTDSLASAKLPVDVPSLTAAVGAAWRAKMQGLKSTAGFEIKIHSAAETALRRSAQKGLILVSVDSHVESLRDALAKLEHDEREQRQAREAEHQEHLALHRKEHEEEESQLRVEHETALARREVAQTACERHREEWLEELMVNAQCGTAKCSERFEEWQAEREVLHGVLRSWEQGAETAREHVLAVQAREAALRKETSAARRQMSDSNMKRRDLQHRGEERLAQTAQFLLEELDRARGALRHQEIHIDHARAAEFHAREAAEQRRMMLASELTAMRASLEGLQRKHGAALRALRELGSGFGPVPAAAANGVAPAAVHDRGMEEPAPETPEAPES